jgi:NAD(P)-dependent dehydrogenase (short-subunit alcohol dehydrogenase family)
LSGSLDGQVVVITGAAQGLGAAIARRSIRAGAAGLLIADRQVDAGELMASRLDSPQTRVRFVSADYLESDAPQRTLAAALEHFGRIDGLVNAAGITDRASFLTGTRADWQRIFAINTEAPFFLMQEAIRQMRQQGSGGSIVNIISMNAHCGLPELAIYSASKGALSTLTRNAANAHAADRIRVNGINLGWVGTPNEKRMHAEVLGKGAQWMEEMAKTRPFGRLLAEDEAANLAVFLLGTEAGVMTGALVDQEQWVVGVSPS